MKPIALAAMAALAITTASAGTIALQPNGAGWQIRLTDVECADGQTGHIAYSTAPDTSDVLLGCWYLVDDQVFVRYADRTIKAYSADGFTIIKKPGKQNPAAKAKGTT